MLDPFGNDMVLRWRIDRQSAAGQTVLALLRPCLTPTGILLEQPPTGLLRVCWEELAAIAAKMIHTNGQERRTHHPPNGSRKLSLADLFDREASKLRSQTTDEATRPPRRRQIFALQPAPRSLVDIILHGAMWS